MAVITSESANVHDLKQINDTLYSIHEKLKYYFMNLDPEDNFSPEAFLKYQEKNGKAAIIEKTSEGIQSTYADLEQNVASQIRVLNNQIVLKVDTGDVTNQMNLEPDALRISGNRLEIYGGNITLDSNNNLTFRGEIQATAGSIAGWTITENEITGAAGSRIICTNVETSEWISLRTVRVNGNSDFSGSDIRLQESPIETDKTTIFLNGFETMAILAYQSTVVCGTCTVQGNVDVSGQITCRTCYTAADGRTWSDARLKENIESITEEEAEDFVMALKPYSYDLRSTGRRSCGFIAQDIEEIQRKSGRDYGLVREDGYLRLNYTGIIPFLIRMIQKQTGALNAAGT